MDANLFTEGAIYYYENSTNTKKDYNDSKLNHDFLVSRPVYVLKSNEIPFEGFTINVVPITSSTRRVGIPINIDGCRNGLVLPFKVFSVHKEYLTKYMGQASPDIMKQVYQAVSYHLGYTDEKPKYIIDYENKVKEEKELIDSFTLKEKSIYTFLTERCVTKENFFVTPKELFDVYLKKIRHHRYYRIQDFIRVLPKVLKLFDGVSIDRTNHVTKIKGLSLNGNVHKEEVVKENKNKKVLQGNPDVVPETCYERMSNEELLTLIDEKSRKAYERLNIVDKIGNYTRSPKRLDLVNYSIDDGEILKQIIVNDVNELKKHVLSLMDKGYSPLNMNTIDQYIIYICTNDEIMKHIDEKYLHKGGIKKIKSNVRKNVKHFFPKISL